MLPCDLRYAGKPFQHSLSVLNSGLVICNQRRGEPGDTTATIGLRRRQGDDYRGAAHSGHAMEKPYVKRCERSSAYVRKSFCR